MCLGVPGQVVSVDEGDPLMRMGCVSFGAIQKSVCLACVPEASVGDYVIVHVGFAISVIDEAEAERVFDALEALGALEFEEVPP